MRCLKPWLTKATGSPLAPVWCVVVTSVSCAVTMRLVPETSKRELLH